MLEPHTSAAQFADQTPSPSKARAAAEAAAQAFPENGEYNSSRVKYLIDVTNLLATRQSFEAGWVGQRMSWLVISQSFLFNAFAAAATQPSIAILIFLKWAVPIMGFVQATSTQISIRAAALVDGELYKSRSLFDFGLRLFAPGLHQLPPLGDIRLGRTFATRSRGALASRVIPTTLMIVWLLLLVLLAAIHCRPAMVDRWMQIIR